MRYREWMEAADAVVLKSGACGTTESAPTLHSLIGIAPDLTGGLDSVEFVRRQRDGLALHPIAVGGVADDVLLYLAADVVEMLTAGTNPAEVLTFTPAHAERLRALAALLPPREEA